MDSESDHWQRLKFWLSAWVPVAVCIAVIALESTSMFGADHTSGPLRWLYQGIFGPISDGRWEILHGHIRKTGHFVGYGIIALAWLRAWRLSLPRFHFMQDAMLALIGTALVSCADEFHQTFLPNRTGNPRDVVLDCCGAITLQFAAYIFLRLFKPKQLTSAV